MQTHSILQKVLVVLYTRSLTQASPAENAPCRGEGISGSLECPRPSSEHEDGGQEQGVGPWQVQLVGGLLATWLATPQ